MFKKVGISSMTPLLIVLLASCGIFSSGEEEGHSATQTLEALATIAQGTLRAALPPTYTPSSAPATTLPTESPEPTILHVDFPAEPGKMASRLTDQSSESLAEENRAIGDSYILNILERPFTEGQMVYLAYLDITGAELSMEPPWVYITIELAGPPGSELASYGIELDLNDDARGDLYITALIPNSSDWTAEGVSVWRDGNGDVGGERAMIADPPNPSLDGYEERVFESGEGEDPDAAWVRWVPEQPNHVQLAFKYSLIESDPTFLWGVWADGRVQQPGWLDYNDHFTFDEAGSPSISDDRYPLKALSEVDNTCRWTYGYTKNTQDPWLCTGPPPTPGPIAQTGCEICFYVGRTRICECVVPCPVGASGPVCTVP